jgi:hypothetical protein
MTTTTRTRDNIIGREIYERIKDLTNPQRIEYFKNVSQDHKDLYTKYNKTHLYFFNSFISYKWIKKYN